MAYLISGYDPYHRGGVLHIPMLNAMLDKTLYPGDYIVRPKNYPSLLWPLTTVLARVFSLPAAMFWLCQLQNFLFHFSAAVLAYVICASVPWSIAVSSIFLLAPRAIIGGSIFYDAARLSHTTISIPFVLLSVSMLVTRRYGLASASWVLALLLHLPNGVFGGLVLLGIVTYPELRRWERLSSSIKPRWIIAIASGGIIVVSAACIIISRNASSISWELLKRLTGSGMGQTDLHIFFSQNVRPVSLFLAFPMQEAFFASALLYLWRWIPRLRPVAFGYVLLHLALVMGIVAEALQSVNLVRLMWIRSADQICLIGFISTFAIAAHPRLLRGPTHVALLLVLSYEIICRAPGTPWMYCAGSIYFLAAHLSRKQCIPPWPYSHAGYLVSAAVLALCVELNVPVARAQAMQFAKSEDTPQYKAFRAAQDWARANTAVDALFLTPPQMNGWRLRSQRSSYLELRDRAAVVLSDKTAQEFVRRSKVLGLRIGFYNNVNSFESTYRQLSDTRLLQLGQTENIAYALMPADKQTSLPAVYTNNTYTLLSLPK